MILEQAKLEAETQKAFDTFLAAPLTRMAMSMIPAGDRQDALQLLLRGAFDAGASHGAGQAAVQLANAIMRRGDMKKGDN